jgi:hypothetical protein
MSCSGKNATIIQHCATFGNLKTRVRKFDVFEEPHARYDAAIHVSFVEPGKRRSSYFTIKSDDHRWLTIEADDGTVLYDSREDVPCDMKKWEPVYQENKAEWLARQAEIDRENAASPAGVHTEQMGNFRD